jgi:hypothetical protein
MSEPRPWLQDGAPNGVKALLESARHDEPTAVQLARMAAKLGPLLVPSSAAAGAASSSSSAVAPAVKAAAVKAGVITKVAIATMTIAAVGGGAFQSGRVYQERTTPPPAPAVIQLPPVAVAPPAPVAEPEPAPVAEAPAPAPAPKPVVAAPAPTTPDAEVALLKSAMAAQAKGDAALALSLSQQHLKRFPHGNFEQEREVIAIEALVGLGRSGEAKKRADSFAKNFPTSTHLLKVESLVGH